MTAAVLIDALSTQCVFVHLTREEINERFTDAKCNAEFPGTTARCEAAYPGYN